VRSDATSIGERGSWGGGLGRCAAGMGLAMMLAACTAEKPYVPGPFAQDFRSVPRKVVPRRPRPVAHPTQPGTTAGVGEASPATPQPEPETVEAQPEIPQTAYAVPSSADLVGLDQQRAVALLGPATATDARSPATVWHYKSGRCELDLAFYMEMRSGRMRSLHYDFKGEAANPEQRRACLKSIIEENRKSEPG
jgi:hypothetical protein